jgi:hypothetical protein
MSNESPLVELPPSAIAPLEERVRDALDADTMATGDLKALLAEIEDAIGEAKAEAKEQHAWARDIGCADYTAAHARAVAAELTIERLDDAIPKLEAKLAATVRAEYRERWLADRRRVQAQRDEAVQNFRQYPKLINELIGIFQQAHAVDQEINRLNAAAPDNVERLQPVELTARDLDSFSRDQPSLASTTELRDWTQSSKTIWPPRHTIDPSLYMPVPTFDRRFHEGRWHEVLAERSAAAAQEQERVTTYYVEQERQRQEREKRPE